LIMSHELLVSCQLAKVGPQLFVEKEVSEKWEIVQSN